MTRHYTVRAFFRQMPNRQLARYFERRGLFGDLEVAKMHETKIDALFEAWMALPETERNRMDAEFQEISALSCEKGTRAILDEAKFQFLGDPEGYAAFAETLAKRDGHHERAMATFLDHNECWKGATLFFEADSFPYWRKRANMPRKPAATDQASRDELARQIRDYFHHVQGRGDNCLVEVLRRDSRDYFFAYPEDFSQRSLEWVNGEFDRRPHNPAFEVVFVYCQDEGTLDLNYRGERSAVEPLQQIFAETILKVAELPPDPKDKRVYDLDPLKSRDFRFVFPPDSGIERVAVKKIRLSSWDRQGDRIVLEANTGTDSDAVYDLLEKLAPVLPLHLWHVTQVEIGASIEIDGGTRTKTVNIRLTHPNSCSLKYDEIDLKLRAMLESSGIEPKEPAEPVQA